jgi:hypothetical protein
LNEKIYDVKQEVPQRVEKEEGLPDALQLEYALGQPLVGV